MGWTGSPGSGALTVDGTVTLTASGSFLVGSGANVASGVGVLAIGNVHTVPSSLASLIGGVLYVQSGGLYFMGGRGQVTLVASSG